MLCMVVYCWMGVRESLSWQGEVSCANKQNQKEFGGQAVDKAGLSRCLLGKQCELGWEYGEWQAWGMLASEVGVQDAFCGHWADTEGLCAEGRHIQTSLGRPF